MNVPKGYEEENKEDITVYHYVEILVKDFRNYMKINSYNYDFTFDQLPFLVKLYHDEVMTQQDLARFFGKTEGYIAKVLNQFEENGLVNRRVNPENKRQKLVSLTDDGKLQAIQVYTQIQEWEDKISINVYKDDMKKMKSTLYELIKQTF